MPKIFLAFANQKGGEPLPTLHTESEETYRVLTNRHNRGHLTIHRDQFADRSGLIEYLNKFKKDIVVFHFSGHANRDALLLGNESVQIIDLLSQAPNLKLVILNGCSTIEQAKQLAELKSHPVVISTNAEVEDHAATQFSIAFFQSFCELERDTQESFEDGIAAAKAIRPDIVVTKGLALRKGNSQKAIWDISTRHKPGLEWRLPTLDIREIIQSSFEPNSILTRQLLKSFSETSKKVAGVIFSRDTKTQRKTILKVLPLPISEQLRKLFAIRGIQGLDQEYEYYINVGSRRLTQLAYASITLLETIAFIHLAQLWEKAVQHNNLIITNQQKEKVKQFLELNLEARRKYPLFELIITIHDIFEANVIESFLCEFKDDLKVLQKDDQFGIALKFFQEKYQLGQKGLLDDVEAAKLCELAEQHLTTVYNHLSFITKYKMVSVKSIDYARYRHKQGTYNHTVFDLIQNLEEFERKLTPKPDALYTASVFIINEKEEYLNLSPFIIDKNAFDPNASLANIYHFQLYEDEIDLYTFTHVYKPKDEYLKVWEIKDPWEKKEAEKRYENYTVFKEQFDNFRMTILNL